VPGFPKRRRPEYHGGAGFDNSRQEKTLSGPFGVISGLCGLSLAFATLLTGAADGGKGKPDRVAAGTWGGQGIAMEVTEKGATLDYDCAHGTVDEAMTLDGSGRLEARGVHAREHGGPVREGESKGQPAVYSGRVDGDTLTLTVKLAGSDEVIGTYTLVRGKQGRIRKCA
jgi:hypothetical protein